MRMIIEVTDYMREAACRGYSPSNLKYDGILENPSRTSLPLSPSSILPSTIDSGEDENGIR